MDAVAVRIGKDAESTQSVEAVVRPYAYATRLLGLAFGAGTQLLFLATAAQLFLFLRGPAAPSAEYHPWRDALLALFFAWPHSLLLFPPMQKLIKRRIHPAFLGCIHCTVTCISLLILFQCWSTSSTALWQFSGTAAWFMSLGFYASWVALLYSLWLTGLGYQTGLTQWFYWLRDKKPPRREFVTRGAYRIMRHPVYLSFLGLIWFTPTMTWDHVILTAVWTVYIYVGSWLKDRRLQHFIGPAYREYAERVPGFPLIGFGIIGRAKRKCGAPVPTA
ncbi:MAG: hypothetical protein U0892_19315 [Pirellulales bacterium]